MTSSSSAARDADGHGGDAEREQREVREARKRLVDLRCGRARPHGELVRDACSLDREVERPGAAQPDAVPCVVELHVRGREEADALTAVVAHRPADDPRAVLRATPPLPPAGHAEAVVDADAAPVRREHAAGRGCRARVDGGGDVGLQERCHRRRGRRDRSAPTSRAIAARYLRHSVDHRHRRDTRTAVGTRQAQRQQPGVGQRRDGDRGESPQALRLVGGFRGRDRDATGAIDDIHGGRS